MSSGRGLIRWFTGKCLIQRSAGRNLMLWLTGRSLIQCLLVEARYNGLLVEV